MSNRLYRSRRDRILAGVCGGVGEYLDTDPSLVRLGWVLLSVLGGSGVLLYILAWLIIPERPQSVQEPDAPKKQTELRETPRKNVSPAVRRERMRALGIVLMVVGGVLLLDRMVYISLRQWWPLLLIAGGVLLLLQGNGHRTDGEPAAPESADEPAENENNEDQEPADSECEDSTVG